VCGVLESMDLPERRTVEELESIDVARVLRFPVPGTIRVARPDDRAKLTGRLAPTHQLLEQGVPRGEPCIALVVTLLEHIDRVRVGDAEMGRDHPIRMVLM
jgi:hypothetical protein